MFDAQDTFANNEAVPTAGGAVGVPIDLNDPAHQIGLAPHRRNVRIDIAGTQWTGSFTSADFSLQDSPDNDSDYTDTSVKVSGVKKAACSPGTTVLRVNFPETGGAAQVSGMVGQPAPGPSPVRRYVQIYVTYHGGDGNADNALYAFFDSY